MYLLPLWTVGDGFNVTNSQWNKLYAQEKFSSSTAVSSCVRLINSRVKIHLSIGSILLLWMEWTIKSIAAAFPNAERNKLSEIFLHRTNDIINFCFALSAAVSTSNDRRYNFGKSPRILEAMLSITAPFIVVVSSSPTDSQVLDENRPRRTASPA